MPLFNSILTWVMKKRIHQIELFQKYPFDVQNELLESLLQNAKRTVYGEKYAFHEIKNGHQFAERVPVVTYESLYPYIDRLMKGEQNILWPSEIKWFAKSSGTTNDRSKFIPVSEEALEDCHMKGGKDMLSLYINNYPDSQMFTGKSLVIGGSQQVNQFDGHGKSRYGDVSAVILKNLPFWAHLVRTPNMKIALMDEWESKIEKMAAHTSEEYVTSMAGVPTWTIVLFERILKDRNLEHIVDIWPGIEIFFHGAVSFIPYKDLIGKLIGKPSMRYLETYNASEGFFGIQDLKEPGSMLLMLDYGIYYEFIPAGSFDEENPRTIPLSEVEIGKNYAMVITTNAGLWRYKIGDTVRFTSLDPFRIIITGRTKHFINAFGEELIIENAEQAISEACRKTNAEIVNFTAAPHFMSGESKGAHEWAIEFSSDPDNLGRFGQILDEKLREINSDYDAKRYRDLALQIPVIHQVKKGSFHSWMKKRGKLGGQNKVPRLSNSRKYLEGILMTANGQ